MLPVFFTEYYLTSVICTNLLFCANKNLRKRVLKTAIENACLAIWLNASLNVFVFLPTND